MKVTIHNYEAFLLDHFEGNLSPEREQELMRFLEAHPELDVDLNDPITESIADLDPEFNTPDFSALKRSDFELPPHIELELAAFLEGDRDALPEFEDEAQLERAYSLLKQCKLEAGSMAFSDKKELVFPTEVDMALPVNQLIAKLEGDHIPAGSSVNLNNPEVAAEWALLNKTKLQPELIAFPNKKSLYKAAVIPMPWVRVAQLAVAAVLIGLVGTLTFYYMASDASNGLVSHANQPNVDRSAYELVVAGTQEEAATVTQAVYQPSNQQEANAQIADRVERVMPLPNRKVQGIGREREQATIALSSRGSANPENYDVAMNNAQPKSDEFVPLKAVLENRLKAGLYGSEQYPQDAYVKALVTKASQKATDKLNSMKGVEVKVKKDKDARRFDLRIGKFSLSRN